MTTPQTPAGWFPDPDGSGGQRYWDGAAWTEHRSPAEPPAPAEPPGSEQPTAVVPTWTPTAAEHVGAHRRAESDDEPESFTQTTEPVAQPFTPGPAPFTPGLPPPPPSAPLFDTPAPAAGDNRGKLAIWYGVACAALLAVLVGAIIYGFFIRDNKTVQIATPGTGTSTAETSTEPTASDGWGQSSETATEAPTAVAEGGEATDGPLSFTVHGFEVGSTVVSSSAPIEKDAQGEYVVVHMTVTNVGAESTSFVGVFQTLNAGGTTYNIDDVATAYLDGTFADLEPAASAEVSIAFDVSPGAVPEAVMLHADPSTPGVEVSLS